MLGLLATLVASLYLMFNTLKNAKPNTGHDADQSVATAASDRYAWLFDIGASPGRIFAGIVAPILLGLGLGVVSSAGFGSFGFALLFDICCCLFAWFWGRMPFGLGTLVALLLIGPAIVVGSGFAQVEYSFTGNVMALLLGLILFSGGISLAAAAVTGPDGVTALSLVAERVHQWPLPLSFVLWDITAIAAGVILGGSIGVATVIGLIAVPFLIQLFLPAFRRVLV